MIYHYDIRAISFEFLSILLNTLKIDKLRWNNFFTPR